MGRKGIAGFVEKGEKRGGALSFSEDLLIISSVECNSAIAEAKQKENQMGNDNYVPIEKGDSTDSDIVFRLW